MIDAMHAAGLGPAKTLDLQPDGRLHRFRVGADKAGSQNGWYVLHPGPVPGGAFGSWRTGANHTWRPAKTTPQTPAERGHVQRQVRAMQQARATELVAVQASARERAEQLWGRAWPATNAHPYLQRKAVHAYGIRQLRDMLVVPARDVHGVSHFLDIANRGVTQHDADLLDRGLRRLPKAAPRQRFEQPVSQIKTKRFVERDVEIGDARTGFNPPELFAVVGEPFVKRETCPGQGQEIAANRLLANLGISLQFTNGSPLPTGTQRAQQLPLTQ